MLLELASFSPPECHLCRNTFGLASKRDWDRLKGALKPITSAVKATAARAVIDELAEAWGRRYPAMVTLIPASGGLPG